MSLPLNRREVLSAFGAVGAAATAATALGPVATARGDHVELGRFTRRAGVQGKMTGAQAVAAALACEGVPCLFGVPGAQNNELWDALKARGVPYMLVANEFSASIMADASSRATGVVGAFAVVPGPGLTNAMTGIGEALYDSVPIVGIISDIDRSPGAPVGQVHGLANAAIVRPVVKAAIEVRHQAEIPGAIFQAFRVAAAGEPGPAVVVIPFPFYQAAWDYDQPAPPPYPVPFDEAAYGRALAHLSDRKRRVGIYAGLGCVDAGPSLAAVAELLQAPVATSVSGKGCIPDAHPLAVGWGYGKQGTRAAESAFKDVDLVLAIGVKYSEVSTANYAIPAAGHPDPRRHQPPVPGPERAHARLRPGATPACSSTGCSPTPPPSAAPPAPGSGRTSGNGGRSTAARPSTVRIQPCVDPMFLLAQLRDVLGPDELVFVDVTASTHWASEAVDAQGPRRYFTPANNQAMGWAIPAAIGAQRVRPDRRVACVTGDGCFLMSAIEMSSAARAGLPVKFFVFDDGAYHYMQMLQEPVYRRTTATEIARIDYAAFAQSVGLTFNQIASNADVLPGLQRAIATPGPVLTQVLVSYRGRDIRWLECLAVAVHQEAAQ